MKQEARRSLVTVLLLMALLINIISLTPARAQTSDPTAAEVIWCPASVSPPTPSKNGCTAAFDQLGDLVTALAAKNPATAGVVWLGKYYNSGEQPQLPIRFAQPQ